MKTIDDALTPVDVILRHAFDRPSPRDRMEAWHDAYDAETQPRRPSGLWARNPRGE